jgi:hypothetical protein
MCITKGVDFFVELQLEFDYDSIFMTLIMMTFAFNCDGFVMIAFEYFKLYHH